jgi:hypothetical protein
MVQHQLEMLPLPLHSEQISSPFFLLLPIHVGSFSVLLLLVCSSPPLSWPVSVVKFLCSLWLRSYIYIQKSKSDYKKILGHILFIPGFDL